MSCESGKRKRPSKNAADLHNKKKRKKSNSFKCDWEGCNKNFPNKYNLKRHINTHRGEKPFKCKTCETGFANKQDLQRHMFTHTGEKPYKCSKCKHRTNRQSNLDKHVLSQHSDVRQFICEGCSQSFAVKQTWQRHMKKCKLLA